MLTRLLCCLAALSPVACNTAIRNPDPAAKPAQWNEDRARVERDQRPIAIAQATAIEEQPRAEPELPSQAATPAPLTSQVSSTTQAQPAPRAQAPASAPQAPAPASEPASNQQPPRIGTVGGEAVTIEDLLGLWMQRDSFELFRQVKHLVANKLVELEARRLGVGLDAALAEQRYRESVADIEKGLAKERPGIKLDDFVSRVLGLDPLRYRERLRADAARGVLAERCVRAFLLENEHAELRMIAVQSEDALKKVQAALVSGTDFAAVAKEHSVDPSGKQGGRMAGVIKSGSIMGRLAFQTPVGGVSAPEYAQGVWLIIKVEARPQAISGGWTQLKPAVEASLADWGIDDVEYKQWETAMEERYKVDLAPLLRLSGQVAR